MGRTNLSYRAAVVLMAIGGTLALCAADESVPLPKPQIPPELREQLRNLPLEEREAKLKEWRDKQRAEIEKRRAEFKNLPEEGEARLRELRERRPEGFPRREEFEKRQEEFRSLPPQERQKRIQEWQDQRGDERREFKGITTEEREARRKEIRARLDKQLLELRKRKTNGTITDAEQRRLEHMEALAKRFDQDGPGSRGIRPPSQPDLP